MFVTYKSQNMYYDNINFGHVSETRTIFVSFNRIGTFICMSPMPKKIYNFTKN